MTPTPSKQRKRRHSNAFEFSMTALATTKMPKAGSEFSSPYWLSGGNKENATPRGNGDGEIFKTLVAHQAESLTHQARTSVTAQVPVRQALEDRSMTAFPHPQQYIGQALLSDHGSFTPDFLLRCVSPADTDPGLSSGAEPGFTIYEDQGQDIAMTGTSGASDPPTPNGLGFEDLSLMESPRRALPMTEVTVVAENNDTSVALFPTKSWSSFDMIRPNDIIIVFDRGKQVVKVDKYPLCASSRFFAELLDGPLLEYHTRVIRLRNDFPWAIRALVEFIDTSNYTFNPTMRIRHPDITMLDLHIHAYFIGAKYNVPKLCELALAQYINLGEIILSMDFVPRTSSSLGDATGIDLAHKLKFASLADVDSPAKYEEVLKNETHRSAVLINTLLDSFALLWKKTADDQNELRVATLELIVSSCDDLLKLPSFRALMQDLHDFGDDVVRAQADNGFEVPVVKRDGPESGIRFGEARGGEQARWLGRGENGNNMRSMGWLEDPFL